MQSLLVTNSVVLARTNLIFVGSGTAGSGSTNIYNINRYVKRVYFRFANNNVAVPLNAFRCKFTLPLTGFDYGHFMRNDLNALNYGLVESSPFIEEFRMWKENDSAVQYLYNIMYRVENDVATFIWTAWRVGATINWEMYIQDE